MGGFLKIDFFEFGFSSAKTLSKYIDMLIYRLYIEVRAE